MEQKTRQRFFELTQSAYESEDYARGIELLRTMHEYKTSDTTHQVIPCVGYVGIHGYDVTGYHPSTDAMTTLEDHETYPWLFCHYAMLMLNEWFEDTYHIPDDIKTSYHRVFRDIYQDVRVCNHPDADGSAFLLLANILEDS